MEWHSLLVVVCIWIASWSAVALIRRRSRVPEEPTPTPVADQEPSPLTIYEVDGDGLVFQEIEFEDYLSGESGLLEALQYAVPDSVEAISLRGDLAVIGLKVGWIHPTEVEQILGIYALVNTACSDPSVRFATFTSSSEAEWLIPLGTMCEPDFAYLEEEWWRTSFEVVGDSCSLTLLEVPTYFRPAKWSASGELIGTSGDHLGHYDIDDGQFTSWGIEAWNAIVSPQETYVAFQDGAGLHYFTVSDRMVQMLALPDTTEDPGMPGIVSWSPDQMRLLFSVQWEWDATYHLYVLDGDSWRTLDMELEGYFLTHGEHWFDYETILFDVCASRREDGTTGYSESGFSGDVLRYGLSADEYAVIAGASDGGFWRSLGRNEGGAWFLLRGGDALGRMFLRDVPGKGTPVTLSDRSYLGAFVNAAESAVSIKPSPMLFGPFSWFTLDLVDEAGVTSCLRFRGISHPESVQWAPRGDRVAITSRRIEVVDPRAADNPERLATVLVTVEK